MQTDQTLWNIIDICRVDPVWGSHGLYLYISCSQNNAVFDMLNLRLHQISKCEKAVFIAAVLGRYTVMLRAFPARSATYKETQKRCVSLAVRRSFSVWRLASSVTCSLWRDDCGWRSGHVTWRRRTSARRCPAARAYCRSVCVSESEWRIRCNFSPDWF